MVGLTPAVSQCMKPTAVALQIHAAWLFILHVRFARLSVLQPEDAAKDVNLKPPKFFVAGTASQRKTDSPTGSAAPLSKTGGPPIVIVSYGSTSTPTASNFHHGLYALAQPEAAAQPQRVRPAPQSISTYQGHCNVPPCGLVKMMYNLLQ